MTIPREIKIVIFATLGVTVLTVGLLVVSRLGGREQPLAWESRGRGGDSSLLLSDFLLEPDGEAPGEGYTFLRPPRERWEEGEINRFWRSPGVPGLKILTEENDELIRSRLQQGR
ncbi:MAG: hypothetical protein LBQ61_03970 [Spirochaetales bacterium]|jgi:hypothetical protein|nr:hypothetical protein [Spirochaetales bacterium]